MTGASPGRPPLRRVLDPRSGALVIAFTSMALLVSLLPGAEPAARAAEDQPPQRPGPEITIPSQPPAFVVSAQQKSAGRPGGTGIVDITIPRRKAAGVDAHGLVVRVTGPRKTRVKRVRGFTPPRSGLTAG